MRLPVAAKIAFATAAAIGGTPGSPAPPQISPPLGTRCTSILGASARRTMRTVSRLPCTAAPRDLSVQCGRQAKDHGASSLFDDGLRVDHVTGVERDSDPRDRGERGSFTPRHRLADSPVFSS
jgi:hypothetical protein